MALGLTAVGLTGCGHNGTPGTEVVHVVAADLDGQPVGGYRLTPSGSNVNTVSDCDGSPAAVAPGIYRCSPSAAGADVCWPAPDALLCVDDPWHKTLHRVAVAGVLPQVQPPNTPQPFALLLEGDLHCRLRNGGAWGGRDDGYIGAYGCESSDLVVLAPADGKAVDDSATPWKVKVGELGTGEAHFPPPTTVVVRTAWFAGDPG